MTAATPAVFLDRDGTLIEHVHYLSRPEQVRLLPGAASALSEWRALGYACIVVTNQAAVSKGILSLDELARVHARLRCLIEATGASINGIYYSTEAQHGPNRNLIEHPDRKPGPGLLLRAARERHLDLERSWMIGDTLSDTLAGRNAGCACSVLVRGKHCGPMDEQHPSVDFVVNDLLEAALLLRLQAVVGVLK
ncbi:MAG TPA: HAD family hydrolase [Polyangiaceae bacterium]|nr:HAD family hydrolase [Polyangiaceae bacterium]